MACPAAKQVPEAALLPPSTKDLPELTATAEAENAGSFEESHVIGGGSAVMFVLMSYLATHGRAKLAEFASSCFAQRAVEGRLRRASLISPPALRTESSINLGPYHILV